MRWETIETTFSIEMGYVVVAEPSLLLFRQGGEPETVREEELYEVAWEACLAC